ncbi:phiSA1p31-related protein [Streptomyces cyaneofuscatus]|uniref:phiSA1p31-related protein n=1 Tax=Streptomyces cyaneofuscatus TaxID=66883 RepID=UPI003420B7CD
MATAQYETRTRTVEETVVVLTLTEDEAKELREHIERVAVSGVVYRVYEALIKSTPPAQQPAPAADTFEYDGVTYELNATYVDRDGDKWHFARIDGEVIGGGDHKPEDIDDGCSLDFIMDYRPLTKVTP